jgi:hypothetical protein
MSFGTPSVYTVFHSITRESYSIKDCEIKKKLLSGNLGTSVFMPLLDLYDIDFHV